MTYDILSQKVLSAKRQKEYKTYPDAERQLVTYLLSQLWEGLQTNRFRGAGKVYREVEVFEINFEYQHICIFTRHKYSALVKTMSYKQGQQISIETVVDFLQKLGLKCEYIKHNNRIEKMFVKIPLDAKTETP